MSEKIEIVLVDGSGPGGSPSTPSGSQGSPNQATPPPIPQSPGRGPSTPSSPNTPQTPQQPGQRGSSNDVDGLLSRVGKWIDGSIRRIFGGVFGSLTDIVLGDFRIGPMLRGGRTGSRTQSAGAGQAANAAGNTGSPAGPTSHGPTAPASHGPTAPTGQQSGSMAAMLLVLVSIRDMVARFKIGERAGNLWQRFANSEVGKDFQGLGETIAQSRVGRTAARVWQSVSQSRAAKAAKAAGGFAKRGMSAVGRGASAVGSRAAAFVGGSGGAAAGGAAGAAAGLTALINPITAVLILFGALAVAGWAVHRMFRAQADELEEFSGAIKSAREVAKARRTVAQVARAQKIGGNVAQVENAKANLSDALYRLNTTILESLTSVAPQLKTIVETVTAGIHGMDAAVNALQYIHAYWFNTIDKDTGKPAKDRELGEALGAAANFALALGNIGKPADPGENHKLWIMGQDPLKGLQEHNANQKIPRKGRF